MDKSINDIHAQAERCVAMLHSRNDGYWRTPMQIRKIARRVAYKRGISLFERNKDKKFAWHPSKFEKHIPRVQQAWWYNMQLSPAQPRVESTEVKSVEEAPEVDKAQLERTLNDLCRHQTIHKLLADINTDINICKLNGWDVREYPNMILTEMKNILK